MKKGSIFSVLALFTMVSLMAACSSKPKKPEIGECIQKQSSSYGETIYEVIGWESGVFPDTRNKKTGKIRVLTEYQPKLYPIVDCP